MIFKRLTDTSGVNTEVINQAGQLAIMLAIVFMVYGLYLSGALFSIHILLSRGILKSRARLTLFVITIIQLLASTAYVLLMLMGDAYPLATAKKIDSDWSVHVEVFVVRFAVANDCLARMNFLLSDGIVVWRAWVLFPSNLFVRIVLVLCMLASSVFIFLDSGLDAKRDLDYSETLSGKVHGPAALTLFMSLPLLVTNVTATSLIAYKAW
ncbi:hypothetical protein K435DRAFT_874938 [Dendrothele bispora CBS 962.96]|uniref:Uncharacterized protein n=1 Tax=Dendrothele bispora (strain CBS 962.96) TaxID=1314807 RepID=A0A4S8KWJ2_DENBC|nr:hypothetical protein K435DRAFT_874936 [Dendrothele bispora CBS 962.96]THU79921.1 hypothetical protein K435DRAFT_874938 [Dendrothele bispora CBS 962.96]